MGSQGAWILLTGQKGVGCQNHGLGRHSKEIIAEYWDKRSESYAGSTDGHKDEELEVWKRCLETFTADLSLHKALDVGTGPGFLSVVLNDMGMDVTGLDMSRCMLNQAKKASCNQRANLTFCQGDAEALPFQSSSFDLVVSRHLLWTLPNPEMALTEWVRILQPGGRILAFDGNHFDPAASKRLVRWIGVHLSRFSHDRNPVPFRKFYKPIEEYLPLYAASGPDQYLAIFEAAGLSGVTMDRLNDVNRFYKENKNTISRLANADMVFLVKGEKSDRI
jgi:ubiquinone/menaquinone biosynthesis C-methylase UbiE